MNNFSNIYLNPYLSIWRLYALLLSIFIPISIYLTPNQVEYLTCFPTLTSRPKPLKNPAASHTGKVAQVNNAKKTQIKLITTQPVKKPFEKT
jgi:hypothetical protein